MASIHNWVKQTFLNFILYLQLEYWLKQITSGRTMTQPFFSAQNWSIDSLIFSYWIWSFLFCFLNTNQQPRPAVWLTQPVDICLHLFHPLEHPLTPDGVVVMVSLESLRMDVDLPVDGAQVQQRCGHAEQQQQPFNPAGSHPSVHFEVRWQENEEEVCEGGLLIWCAPAISLCILALHAP